MDQSVQSRMLQLIAFLESLLASTHDTKLGILAHANEAQSLLQGWILAEEDADATLPCRCLESQKHQISSFLEKVEKAVKYSQSIREGRSDVTSPWADVAENDSPESDGNKINTLKGGRVSKISTMFNRDKMVKLRQTNGPSKRSSGGIAANTHKLNAALPEHQEPNSLLCPLHSESQSQKLKKVQTVGLAEALDVKGIPPELVTVLKSVHQYINRLRTTNLKNRAEASFEKHLNSVNANRWDQFSAFSSLLKNLPTSTYCRESMLNCGTSDLASIAENRIPFLGLWNPAISNIFSGGALCVEYQNEDMWHSLQLRMQQLQLSQAEWQLCDILCFDPLLSNPDLRSSTASLFYKAASALSQLTTLSWPVLVKTFQGQ